MSLTSKLPDTQASKPLHKVPIDKVGVEDVYRRICLKSFRGKICLDTSISVSIDLPKEQRGIHVSRDIEAILDVFNVIEYSDFSVLEEAVESLSRELLKRHNYASKAEASIKTIFIYEYRDSTLSLEEHVPVKLSIKSKVIDKQNNVVYRTVCIEVIGMTVCPCAQQVCSHTLNIDPVHAPSHTQRAKLSICVKSRSDPIDIEALIVASLESFSTPVFSHLKRDNECKLILKGFKNAKFAEDVVRDALYNLYKRLNNAVGLDEVFVMVKSYESIHPFNMVIKARYKLSELGKYLMGEG
ncbi:MAG: GTP cyclohydrolase, FolE2/MptA family [Sulfolobales archaeon]|nr:GTP cyclohydrolase, FolE2/MptA family [Sulfolobales archaeon]MCX8199172.1 GTP cyclohydrolase, FolE2/MptA family [Sulfolobales archaeon]MDW8170152.1 GTP cyclohydrolase, FolE2/MptA family [Desulfurococcaceae archaeon]